MRQPRGPWKNRIVATGDEAPDQLLANPANWRSHPELQQDELSKILETVGWVQRVIVNRRTGHLVDGHLRVQLALRRDEETVPVTYIDVSQAEERLILATLDPLAALAGRVPEKLDELVTDVIADFGDTTDIDLAAILKREKRESVKGLTHDVNACTCCDQKCRPGCGCWREDVAQGSTLPKPRLRKKRGT